MYSGGKRGKDERKAVCARSLGMMEQIVVGVCGCDMSFVEGDMEMVWGVGVVASSVFSPGIDLSCNFLP
jgi:hypothetical protein